ncbi:MAG TPA: undecaprenyl-diphosphate phosphatase, partial [Patescibacteria group bacterium]|nr:undecaprenyl-diphosphate phosphatase [Patescibacteria group bacterium]
SIPIIFGAGLLKLPEIIHIQDHTAVAVGFVSAAIFGFLSIKFMMAYIAKKSYALFTWYRLALALLIILVYISRK